MRSQQTPEDAPRGRGRRGPGREERRAFGEAIAEAMGAEFGGPGGPRGHGRGRGHGGPGGPEGLGPGMGRGPRGRGFGRPGGWQTSDLPSVEDVESWFSGRLPKEWFTSADITTDREEILVIGTLNEEPASGPEAEGIISRFRSQTKDARIEIAREAEHRYGRKVSWGVRLGETQELFTHVAAPVMTRLRQPERQILDTLVDAGVARSRSDGLAWCVRLVGEHSEDWLGRLREAMSEVDKLRAEGPTS